MFTSTEVASALDVPYRTLVSWIRRRQFKMRSYDVERRRSILFSEEDLKRIAVYASLRRVIGDSDLAGAVLEAIDELVVEDRPEVSRWDALVTFESKPRAVEVKLVERAQLKGDELMLIPVGPIIERARNTAGRLRAKVA